MAKVRHTARSATIEDVDGRTLTVAREHTQRHVILTLTNLGGREVASTMAVEAIPEIVRALMDAYDTAQKGTHGSTHPLL